MILLWLDDKRNPINFIDKYNLSAFINSGEIVWVKSYEIGRASCRERV